tara:strand:- start:159 stop:908 length:750 start_codon:yes stop_codon:yes gene_type:complete
MKLTLLEIVQDMLTATDSENVTSVGHSEDAGMCVNIANREFERLISKFRWRHTRAFSKLEVTSVANEMTLATNAVAIKPDSVYYSDARIEFMDEEDFLAFTITRNTSETNIIDSNNIKIYNDRDPQFYTSFNDETLVFDAIPNGSGLVKANTDCIIYNHPTSRLTLDGEYFDLPKQAFSALAQRCIARAVLEIKGDTQGYQAENSAANNAVAALSRNARLVDVLDDRRDRIVPRRSMRNTFNRTQRITP